MKFWFPLVVAVLLASCAEVAPPLEPAEVSRAVEVEAPSSGPRTVEEIRESGSLRVLMRNDGNGYFVWKGRQMGFHFELASRLADDLGVDLEITVPRSWGDLGPLLEATGTDLVCATLLDRGEEPEDLLYTDPYGSTDLVLVWGRGAEPVESLFELAGRRIDVLRSSASVRVLEEINMINAAFGLQPIRIVEVDEGEPEEMLEEVVRGRIDYTLAPRRLAEVNQVFLRGLALGPAVTPVHDMVWAVHGDAGDLRVEVDDFLRRVRREPTLNVVERRYYEYAGTHAKRQRERSRAELIGRLSPWDDFLSLVAENHGLDWRLLAAIAYQESAFDSGATSFAGACGVFQVMPRTAEELGLDDPTDPFSSAEAGASYFAGLLQRFSDVEDFEQRVRLALAAYNCGAGHVRDARLLATRLDLDGDHWSGVSRALLLLSRREYYRTAASGYVRGREPVGYVNEIWARYRAYLHDSGHRDHPDDGSGALPVSGVLSAP